MAKKAEKKAEPTKVKVIKAPKAEAKPKTKKINKSAKDGKIVSKEFAAANPDTTFEQVVDLPSPPVVVQPDPISKFYRKGAEIIEICGDVCTRHWKENGIHCTEGIEMSDSFGDEMSRSEMFRELNG